MLAKPQSWYGQRVGWAEEWSEPLRLQLPSLGWTKPGAGVRRVSSKRAWLAGWMLPRVW